MKKDGILCGLCSEPVVKEDKAVQCEGFCEKWHHIACVMILVKEYEWMKKLGGKSHWFCEECANSTLSKVMSNLNDLKEIVSSMACKINSLQEENILLKEIIHTSTEQNAEILRVLVQR